MTTVTPLGEPPAGFVVSEVTLVDGEYLKVKCDTPVGVKYLSAAVTPAMLVNPTFWQDVYSHMVAECSPKQ